MVLSVDDRGQERWWAVLTRRERMVLLLVESGATIEAMAARLQLSEGTIKAHLRHIYTKLGVHNRVQAAAFARRLRREIGRNHENGRLPTGPR
jgi:DNA-binding NarL/FixJ family response regulator